MQYVDGFVSQGDQYGDSVWNSHPFSRRVHSHKARGILASSSCISYRCR